jgi:dipeptidyl-peptidase-4
MFSRFSPPRSLHILCISLALLAATPPASSAEEVTDPSRLTLDRIFKNREFQPEEFGPARWMKDGSGYTTLEESEDFEEARDIVLYEPATGGRTVLVPASRLIPAEGEEPLAIDDYHWSADGTRLLVFTNTERVWRRNTRGDYWLLRLADNTLQKLGGDAEASSMMFAKISPDNSRVAWVDFESKELFVQDLATLEVIRLTDDEGEHIINGTSDWVYEEEFGIRDGFRWSPDGRRIAYWQFDSAGVGTFNLINNTDSVYPELTPLPYPKVGTTNSAVRVGVIPVEGGTTTWFEPEGDSRNYYIPMMGWAESPEEIWLVRLNRLQNTADVMLGTVSTGEMKTVYTDHDDAWIDMHDDPTWLDDGASFTWLSERDGWRHLYVVSRSGNEVRLVTSGDYDVTELAHIDEEGGWAYVMASPDDPTTRYLYRTRLDGTGELERITPDLPGVHIYQISGNARWAIHSWSSRERVPTTELVALPGHDAARVLEDNAELAEAVEAVAKAPVRSFRVDIGDVELDGWMITPPDFDPSKSYPLLMFVYGEPAGQTVQNSWGRGGNLWYFMLAQRGYLVASIDNRGTPAPRGREWRKAVYRQIGILASADQAAGVRAMIEAFPFIDPERIGSWGWSGGGTMTLNALFRYPELYSMGMAVAFVADQKLYDTVYQERYMALPEDNPDGYREGSPITHAGNLQGDLLLVHGTGDDNVHYQNLEMLVNELIAEGLQFDMMAYPNRSHGIREGKGTTLHLYTLLTNYLEEHLEPGPKPMRVEKVAQATSLLGEPLFPPTPAPATVESFETARAAWEASPDDPEAIIWYGRRAAYLGNYQEAIRIYSTGIELYPEDARLYRHRGHRYISTRQFDEAIADFEHAAWLIEGREDEVEPDGMPNALGIPVSTLHSNIWYHLGLAYYLSGDFGRASQAYAEREASAANDDMLVSTAHWRYMTLRRLGRDEEAAAVLEPINADMEIIENSAYQRLCLFYRGELAESDLVDEGSGPANAAVAYGIANWHLANGDTERGIELLEEIVAGEGWAAFGYIAAEADLARIRN